MQKWIQSAIPNKRFCVDIAGKKICAEDTLAYELWKILNLSPLNTTPTTSDTEWAVWAVTTNITLQHHCTAIHGSSLGRVQWILNKPFTNSCSSDDKPVVVAHLSQTVMWSIFLFDT